MNLLQLARKARDKVTGRNKWVACYRHLGNDNGGELVCALGAIESVLSIAEYQAEHHPLGKKLIELMAMSLGWPSYKKACLQYKKDNGKDAELSYRTYIDNCAGCIIQFNDNGTQRKVQGLFQRVITKLEKKCQTTQKSRNSSTQ